MLIKRHTMSGIAGAVYLPPRLGLPPIAVVFGPTGEILVARKVSSIEAGDALLEEAFQKFAREAGVSVKRF
jgi:hypothetical protein